MKYVVVCTDNLSENGNAYICNDRTQADEKFKEVYKKLLSEVVGFRRDESYVNEDRTFGVVVDALYVCREIRLLEVA